MPLPGCGASWGPLRRKRLTVIVRGRADPHYNYYAILRAHGLDNLHSNSNGPRPSLARHITITMRLFAPEASATVGRAAGGQIFGSFWVPQPGEYGLETIPGPPQVWGGLSGRSLL